MRCPLPGKQGAEQRLYLNYEQVKGLVPSSSPPPRFFYFYLQIPLFARVAARRLICPASRLINACRRTRYPQMPFSLFSAWHCLLDHKVFCKIKKTSKTHCTSNTPENYKKQKSLSCSPVPLYPSSFTAKQKPQFQRAEYFSWACFKGAKSTGHHFNDVYLCFFFNFDAQFVRWGLHVHQGCTRLL